MKLERVGWGWVGYVCGLLKTANRFKNGKTCPTCLRVPDADPDPSIFMIDLQDANKKIIIKKVFSAYYFLKVLLHHFSKVKSQKEVTKQ